MPLEYHWLVPSGDPCVRESSSSSDYCRKYRSARTRTSELLDRYFERSKIITTMQRRYRNLFGIFQKSWLRLRSKHDIKAIRRWSIKKWLSSIQILWYTGELGRNTIAARSLTIQLCTYNVHDKLYGKIVYQWNSKFSPGKVRRDTESTRQTQSH